MTTRTLGVLAACAIAVAAWPATASAVDVPFMRGMTVGEWGPSAYPPKKTRALMRTLKRRHRVDTVTLFVVWEQGGTEAVAISPGEKTAPFVNLRTAIRSARAAGLRVVLRPYVDPANGLWRGEIDPASVTEWFASYTRFILRYVDLARRERVSGFVVGSYLVALPAEAARWRALVAQVRRRFKGFVTYQANWDETQRVAWWDAVDVVSISGYYPVATAPGASLSTLVSGWQRWTEKIEQLHTATGKPVMFGEIGYRTVAITAVTPWDTVPAAFSLSAQVNAYEAALRVWYRVPWFAGFHWWYLAPTRGLVAGRRGADHRPSEQALRRVGRWYRRSRGSPR
jgi:hypothetical protein